jgi:hypothetical protein
VGGGGGGNPNALGRPSHVPPACHPPEQAGSIEQAPHGSKTATSSNHHTRSCQEVLQPVLPTILPQSLRRQARPFLEACSAIPFQKEGVCISKQGPCRCCEPTNSCVHPPPWQARQASSILQQSQGSRLQGLCSKCCSAAGAAAHMVVVGRLYSIACMQRAPPTPCSQTTPPPSPAMGVNLQAPAFAEQHMRMQKPCLGAERPSIGVPCSHGPATWSVEHANHTA